MTNPFEYWTPILSGIQVFGIQMVIVLVISYQSPVLHGPALEVRDGNAVVLGQRVADVEVVLVERDGLDAGI